MLAQGQPGNVCAKYGITANNCTATSYYQFGGQRIGLREQTDGNPTGVVYYLHSDHLGSASLTTDATGKKVGELRYKPYGETRFTFGDLHTTKRWTGQRSEESLLGSLYDFKARFMSPILGRFISPDSIVATPGNPQAFNRYAAMANNPIKFTDSSGHWVDEPGEKKNATREEISRRSYRKNGKFDPFAYAAALMNQNASIAKRTSAAINSGTTNIGIGLLSPLAGPLAKNFSFIDHVAPGHDWDIKFQLYDYAKTEGISKKGQPGEYPFQSGSLVYDTDDLGNLHFAFGGRAYGFSENYLKVGAGIAQFVPDAFGGTEQRPTYHAFTDDFPRNLISGWDQPNDMGAINAGFQLWETKGQYGIPVTGDDVRAALHTSPGTNIRPAKEVP